MPLFRVTYVRVTYETAQDAVEADDQTAAEAAAAEATKERLFLDWQTDDQEQRVLFVEPLTDFPTVS